MHTEIRRTRMEITSDPRLRAGVRAALEQICERHGLGKAEQHELVASVENECTSGNGATCAVTVDEMEDRMEVTVAAKENPSGTKSSLETNSAKHHGGEANHGKSRVFVKHFQKNATHS